MPIRTVIMNWGDGNSTPVSNAKYQNHKPRCQREVGELLGRCIYNGKSLYGYACANVEDCGHFKDTTCNNQGDYFGDTSGQENADACREGYFQYKHTYTCAGVGSAGWDALKGACKFELGVQVLDNRKLGKFNKIRYCSTERYK